MTRRSVMALASAVLLLGCNADVPTTPASKPPVLATTAALVASFNLPVEYPTGLASDGGMFLYLSTGSGYRETHRIHRVLQADVGTIPTGGEPRDVTFDGTNLLFSDLGSRVDERTVLGTFVNSFALPFRGGGIATDGDTIWVGDVDHNVMYMTANFGAAAATFTSAVRIEGMVFDPSSKTLWAITPFPGDHHLYELTTYGTLIRTCDSDFEGGPSGLGGIALVSDTFYVAEPLGGDPTAGTTILVFEKASLVCTPALVQNVNIQITPSSIHPGSNGVMKVAILTDATFNATTVDASSVRFGHDGSEAAAFNVVIQDVGNDGDLDMVLWFKKQDTGFQCGDQAGVLTGKTLGGQKIRGTDGIHTVGCHP